MIFVPGQKPKLSKQIQIEAVWFLTPCCLVEFTNFFFRKLLISHSRHVVILVVWFKIN